jgi:hypothetical protein
MPQTIIHKLLGAPSSDAYTLTPEDLDAIGERSAWYEEWLLARCPNYVKVENETRKSFTEERGFSKEYKDALTCEAAALEPEISAGLWNIEKRQMNAVFKKYSKPKN